MLNPRYSAQICMIALSGRKYLCKVSSKCSARFQVGLFGFMPHYVFSLLSALIVK